jgi:hypothetical protein
MIFERGYFDSSSTQDADITKSLVESRIFDSTSAFSSKPTIFLSHKHEDLKDLKGVLGKFRELGAEVYIDSMDNKMPNQTSGQTALRIKEVIKFCNKFVLLATDKAIESYWCNWELGIGDTHKYIENLAILPMKEKGSQDYHYKGNEYLQIYPTIDYQDGTRNYSNGTVISRGFYVVKPPMRPEDARVFTPLIDWIKRQ